MVSWKRIENLDTGSAVVSCPLSLSAFSWTRSVEAFFCLFSVVGNIEPTLHKRGSAGSS